MGSEISEQPDIFVPESELSDAMLALAEHPINLVEEVKVCGDVDADRFEMGCAIWCILNDDGAVCLAWSASNHDPDGATISKEMLRIRMGWESGISGFPDEVRSLISDCMNDVMTRNWSMKEDYTLAKDKWCTMQNSLRKMMIERGDLGYNLHAALQYYFFRT